MNPDQKCLNPFEISKCALGRTSEPRAAHLASCPACRSAVEAEAIEVRAAKLEPVPAALRRADAGLTRAPAYRRAAWAAGVLGVAGACVAGALGIAPFMRTNGHESSVRTKGAVGVEPVQAQIYRDRKAWAAVLSLDELERVGVLKAHDILQVRILGPWSEVELLGREANDWVSYYRGPSTPDGWLQTAVEVTPEGETSLRVRRCRGPAPTYAPCITQNYALKVAP